MSPACFAHFTRSLMEIEGTKLAAFLEGEPSMRLETLINVSCGKLFLIRIFHFFLFKYFFYEYMTIFLIYYSRGSYLLVPYTNVVIAVLLSINIVLFYQRIASPHTLPLPINDHYYTSTSPTYTLSCPYMLSTPLSSKKKPTHTSGLSMYAPHPPALLYKYINNAWLPPLHRWIFSSFSSRKCGINTQERTFYPTFLFKVTGHHFKKIGGCLDDH